MTRHHAPTSRRLGLEGLESRTLMAGNVTVTVTDGVLRVQGDELANDVQIRPIAQTFTGEWPGAKYEITGNSRYNGSPTTTINGQTSVIVEGVKRGASIGLGHGTNSLQIPSPGSTPTDQRPATVPGAVTINTGSDADSMRLYIKNGAQVTINTGGGNDRLDIARSTLNRLTINTDWSGAAALPRAGNDQVLLGASTINGAANIYMGPSFVNGGDTLGITYGTKFNAGLSFNGVISSLQWWPGTVRSQVTGPVDIIAQWVSIEHVDFNGSLTITGNARVSGGGLSDVTVTEQISMFGLDGDDVFSFEDVTSPKTLLNGGDHNDTYRDFGGNNLGELTLVSIENLETP